MIKKEDNNLGKLINQLSEISEWFENQKDIDIELGLEKIKKATFLIKESKERLKEVENEFEEIKKDL